jgi:hypothetical protein
MVSSCFHLTAMSLSSSFVSTHELVSMSARAPTNAMIPVARTRHKDSLKLIRFSVSKDHSRCFLNSASCCLGVLRIIASFLGGVIILLRVFVHRQLSLVPLNADNLDREWDSEFFVELTITLAYVSMFICADSAYRQCPPLTTSYHSSIR